MSAIYKGENRVIQTKLGFFITICDRVDAILEDVSVAKIIFNAKLLIQRLSSFIVPKVTALRQL